LAPYSYEQQQLLRALQATKLVDSAKSYKDLIFCFLKKEILYKKQMQEAFEGELLSTFVFDTSNIEGMNRWKEFQLRIVEHNVRIVAGYYTKISIERLSALLDLSAEVPLILTVGCRGMCFQIKE
jgi:26S proteasome regulatory subunit N5